MHFVFSERSHFSSPTSFWQVPNQFSIPFFQYCCKWTFIAMSWYVFTLSARWICWYYPACLAYLISQIMYKLKCVSCCLVCGFKWVQLLFWAFVQIKGSMAHSLWWSAWYNCMRRLIYEHGLSKISFEFIQSLQHCNYQPVHSLNLAITLGVIRCCTKSFYVTKPWQVCK